MSGGLCVIIFILQNGSFLRLINLFFSHYFELFLPFGFFPKWHLIVVSEFERNDEARKRIKSSFKSRPLAGYYFIFHLAAFFSSLVLNQWFLLSLRLRLVHFWDTFQHLISTLPTQKNKQGPKDQSWEPTGRIPVDQLVAWKLFFLEVDFFNSMLLTPRPSQESQQLIGGRLPDGLKSRYLVLDSGSGTHRASASSLGSLWCFGLLDLEWMPPYVGELSCLYICDFYHHPWAGYSTSSLAACRCLMALILFWLFRSSSRVLAVQLWNSERFVSVLNIPLVLTLSLWNDHTAFVLTQWPSSVLYSLLASSRMTPTCRRQLTDALPCCWYLNRCRIKGDQADWPWAGLKKSVPLSSWWRLWVTHGSKGTKHMVVV